MTSLALSHLISPSGGLKKLVMGHKDMQRDCMDLLLEGVLSPSSLQSVCLVDMRIDMTSVSLAPLKENCNITHLAFSSGTMGSRGISYLHSNTMMENVTIGDNSLPTFYTHPLFLFGSPRTVHSDPNRVTDSLKVLADALKVNQSLKELMCWDRAVDY